MKSYFQCHSQKVKTCDNRTLELTDYLLKTQKNGQNSHEKVEFNSKFSSMAKISEWAISLRQILAIFNFDPWQSQHFEVEATFSIQLKKSVLQICMELGWEETNE